MKLRDIFSFRLYLEGLKKIRLVGVAAAITVLALNALIPMLDIVGTIGYVTSRKTILSYLTFIPFGLLMMVFAVIMVHSMFSYLNERRDSDFYHSIPQKRSCVYISFLAAILTWIFGILAASSLLNAILWGIAPHYVYSASAIFLSVLVLFLAAAMVASFMALAMMFTGTTISNWLIFTLLFLFVRVVGGIFVSCIDNLLPMFDVEYSFWKILSPNFFLPFVSITATLENNVRGITTGVIVYSVLVTVALYVLAGVAYVKRRSESAMRSAPNRILQHAYRCAVTLPFMLLGAFVMIEGNDFDLGTALVYLFISFIVYAVFELLTTKKLKNLVKSLPIFLIPILLTGVFTLSVYGTRNAVLNNPIEADEIASISFYTNSSMGKTYNDILTENLKTEDEEAKKLVADILAEVSEAIKDDTYGTYRYYGEKPTEKKNIAIKLKSGRTVGRVIRMLKTDADKLESYFMNSEDYRKANLSLPADKYIRHVSFSYASNEDMTDRLWATFVLEYRELSDAAKFALLEYSQYEALTTMIVQGTYDQQSFTSDYPITMEYTPKTAALYLKSLREDASYRSWAEDFVKVSKLIGEDDFAGNVNGSVGVFWKDGDMGSFHYYCDANNEETVQNFKAVISVLEKAVSAGRDAEDGIPVRFNCWIDSSEKKENWYFEGDLFAVLTEEEYAELLELQKQIEDNREKAEVIID